MKNDKLLYSRAETAKLLGVCILTVDHLVQRGELIPRKVGRRVLFSHAVVQGFVAGATPSKKKSK